MNRIDKALSDFDQGFNCSQSVLVAFAEELGLSRELALRLASGFGGGMGRMGETCGAITGAFMVLGLKMGFSDLEDNDAKANIYRLVNQFAEQFKEKYQSLNCKQLTGFDLSKPEEQLEAQEQKVFDTVCVQIVKDVVQLLNEKF